MIAGYSSLKGVSENYTFEDILASTLYSMINKLRKTFPYYKFYACWDTFGGTQFRKDIDSNYKSNRDHSAVSLNSILAMKPLFKELEVENIEIPQTEADDTIYTLAKVLREKYPQSSIVVVSRDKDLIQAVQAGYATNQYDPVKKKNLDIPWYSIVDYKALVGDASDNIPGVKGVGQKTAIKYLLNPELIKESQKEDFERYKKMIDASKHPRFTENLEYLEKIVN